MLALKKKERKRILENPMIKINRNKTLEVDI